MKTIHKDSLPQAPNATCQELKDNTKKQEPVSLLQVQQKRILMSDNMVKEISLHLALKLMKYHWIQKLRKKEINPKWVCDLPFDFQMTLGLLLWSQLWGRHNAVTSPDHKSYTLGLTHYPCPLKMFIRELAITSTESWKSKGYQGYFMTQVKGYHVLSFPEARPQGSHSSQIHCAEC